MLVEVKPLPAKKWHGKEGQDSFSQPKTVEALYDSNTGRYATGLTDEEAEEYGKKMGVNLSSIYVAGQPHEYWETKPAAIKLPNNTTFFNDELPSDFVKIKVMKASKFVANSYQEWEQGLWPHATHVIYSEAEEIAVKATKVQLRRRIEAHLQKISNEEKGNLILVLTGKDVRARSTDFLDVELADLVDSKPNELSSLFKLDKEALYAQATIKALLQRHILTREGVSVYYMGEQIAHNEEAAAQWLMKPDNQIMKAALLEKLK